MFSPMVGLQEMGVEKHDENALRQKAMAWCKAKSTLPCKLSGEAEGREPRHQPFRLTGFMEYRVHSGLMPANLITLPRFSVSSAMSFAKSAGEPGSASPRSARRTFILGSARAALTSLLSCWTISAGVFLGTPTPYHDVAS
jgi:hypothetical protein